MSVDHKNVHVFIDGPNLHQGVKACIGDKRLDIQALAEKLCTPNRKLVGISYYDAPYMAEFGVSNTEEQQRFFQYLKNNPKIDTRWGYHAKHAFRLSLALYTRLLHHVKSEELVGPVEKSVDTQLVADIVSLAYQNKFGTAILIAGDADYVRAVEIVRSLKLKVQNAYFCNEKRRGSHLKNVSSSFLALSPKVLDGLLLDFSQPQASGEQLV